MDLMNLAAYIVNRFGPIKGKKAFQKIFYFLTESEIPTGLTYSLYLYGPYSSGLESQTGQMEAVGAIEVKPSGMGYRISKGKLTDKLNDIDEEFKQKINSILDNLPIRDPLHLELLSTTHYVTKVQKEIYNEDNPDIIVSEVKEIKKEKFNETEIYDAYQFLKDDGWTS